MKLVALTMMTNPDWRQDPWRESIRQMLEICDEAVVVVGREEDVDLVRGEFSDSGLIQRITTTFLSWPQPEWHYSELPRHLNHGLKIARELGADWIMKLDIDHMVHEVDKDSLRKHLEKDVSWACVSCLHKIQFFLVDRGYTKTQVPMIIKGNSNVWYGMERGKYTDLCQPILMEPDPLDWEWSPDTTDENRVMVGDPIPKSMIASTGVFVWNYDYSFKTEERSRELLHEFDRAHAKHWGVSYAHRQLEEVTPETAMEDYLDKIVKPRLAKCLACYRPENHPKWIRDRILNIKPEEFGHSLWGKIEVTT